MTLLSKLLAFASLIGFFACIFYVAFGQITVRKLRKNPETKGKMGFEYVSGWDIINVAQSLAIPRCIGKRLERGPLSFLYVNVSLLHKHTNLFDRVLGAIFYWLLTTSGLMMIGLALLETMGVIDS